MTPSSDDKIIEKEIEDKIEEMEDKYEIETLNSEEVNWFDEFERDISFIRKKALSLQKEEFVKMIKKLKEHKGNDDIIVKKYINYYILFDEDFQELLTKIKEMGEKNDKR